MNLAVNWAPNTFSNQAEFDEKTQKGEYLGGLELVIDTKVVGSEITGEECSGNCTPSGPLKPVEFLIGCHITSSDSTERGFSPKETFNFQYDEISFWNETQMNKDVLLGGYQSVLDSIDSDTVLGAAANINTKDPAQAFMGATVATAALESDDEGSSVDGSSDAAASNNNPLPTWGHEPISLMTSLTNSSNSTTSSPMNTTTTTTTTTPAPTTTTTPSPTAKIRKLVKLMDTLTGTSDLPPIMLPVESRIRMSTQIPVSIIMSTKKASLKKDWKLLVNDNDVAGGEKYKEEMDKYLIYTLQHMNVTGEPEYNDRTLFFKMVISDNFAANMTKLPATEFMSEAKKEMPEKFPDWKSEEWKAVKAKWGLVQDPVESAEYTRNLFNPENKTDSNKEDSNKEDSNKEDSKNCLKEDSFVDVLTELQDTIADFGRKNPAAILSNEIKVISRLMTVKIVANRYDPYRGGLQEPCYPDEKLLKNNPITLRFQHFSLSSLDGSLEDDRVRKTHCAIWKETLGLFGAWDTEGMITKFSDEKVSTCIATKLGTYAVIAEVEDIPAVDPDALWLTIMKSIGFGISIFLLVLFIAIVSCSKYLREMFHLLSANLAAAILFGHLSMIVSELDFIRADFFCCVFTGSTTAFFYTAAVTLLFFEIIAVFNALIIGQIGGKTTAYLSLAWGLPMIALGLHIIINFDEMGDDPRCFIGWYNNVKWVFFIPILSFLGLALLIICIAMCNTNKPALRKETIAEEIVSLVKGLFIFTFVMCFTWSWGPLAYLRFPGIAMPNFYPGFQVLNAFMGMFLFISIGVGSKRFQTVLFRQVKFRVRICNLLYLYIIINSLIFF